MTDIKYIYKINQKKKLKKKARLWMFKKIIYIFFHITSIKIMLSKNYSKRLKVGNLL